jgi:hypothetical protein
VIKDVQVGKLKLFERLGVGRISVSADKNRVRDRARLLEQKIKGAIQSLTSDLRYYSGRYRKKTNFPPLMVEVADACTGGQFESANKTAEASRYLTVVNAINRVKSELMRMKV